MLSVMLYRFLRYSSCNEIIESALQEYLCETYAPMILCGKKNYYLSGIILKISSALR
jgi:hypothetical protein